MRLRTTTKASAFKKSSGIRLVSSRIWKIMYSQFPGVFTKLYNHIINSGQYPKEWKN